MKGIMINDMNQKICLFKFFHRLDMPRVLTWGPWSFDGDWKGFVRVPILMDVRRPLKRRMKVMEVGSEWHKMKFKFEKLPTFYYLCELLKQTEKFCDIVV